MTNGTTPTPEQNAQSVAQLTAAVNMLVSQFIRPNTQQANANRETLDEVIDLLERHAAAIVQIDERLAQHDERLARLEEIVAEIAIKVDRNAEGLVELQRLHTENQQALQILIDEGRADRQAQREILQALNSNRQRIERLEQQAS